MFGDAVEVGTHFVDGGGSLFGECHPWHLIGVRAIGKNGFRDEAYQIEQLDCKPCIAPSFYLGAVSP